MDNLFNKLKKGVNMPKAKKATKAIAVGAALGDVVGSGVNKIGKKAVNVVSYKDNADGTTTNYLSDGTTSVVKYKKNKDGSLQPYEVK